MDLLRRRGVRQFIKFGIVGVSSTIIDWGIYYILTRIFGVFYLLAKIISFVFGLTNSYFWNRRWTFRSQDPKRAAQFSKFVIVASVGLGLNSLIMYIAVGKLHLLDVYGLLISTVFVTAWNFSVNKIWVFKGKEPVVIE